jgi:hypothetical protein
MIGRTFLAAGAPPDESAAAASVPKTSPPPAPPALPRSLASHGFLITRGWHKTIINAKSGIPPAQLGISPDFLLSEKILFNEAHSE